MDNQKIWRVFSRLAQFQLVGLMFSLSLVLDHCFSSDTIEVLDFYVGQATGSDHLPIVVKIRWK